MSSSSSFDRNVRLPCALVRRTEPLPNSTDEWVARCRTRLVRLAVVLKPDEAHAVASEMSQQSEWRTMVPETAADAVYRQVTLRAGLSDEE